MSERVDWLLPPTCYERAFFVVVFPEVMVMIGIQHCSSGPEATSKGRDFFVLSMLCSRSSSPKQAEARQHVACPSVTLRLLSLCVKTTRHAVRGEIGAFFCSPLCIRSYSAAERFLLTARGCFIHFPSFLLLYYFFFISPSLLIPLIFSPCHRWQES